MQTEKLEFHNFNSAKILRKEKKRETFQNMTVFLPSRITIVLSLW